MQISFNQSKQILKEIDGIHFIHIEFGGVHIVTTVIINISPSLVLSTLDTLALLIKDYCGVVNEEAIRANYVIIYELIDEVIVIYFFYFFKYLLSILIFNFKLEGFRIYSNIFYRGFETTYF